MKMHFTIIIDGLDTIESKFKEAVEKNPKLHMSLIQAFGQAIMVALKLNNDDKVTISGFKAGKIPDMQEPQPIIEKKVDN